MIRGNTNILSTLIIVIIGLILSPILYGNHSPPLHQSNSNYTTLIEYSYSMNPLIIFADRPRPNKANRQPANTLNDQRVEHAKELLGKYYTKSVVKNGERVTEITSFIYDWMSRSLSTKWKSRSKMIAKALLEESEKYEFDPVFLMAVIQSESGFDPSAVGPFGEIGLMQLRPTTAKWIAEKEEIRYSGIKSLLNPVCNIRLGAAYLALLREQFDSHGRLYLAAYNMGSFNVQKALGKNIWPKDYPSRVMQKYIAFYSEIRESQIYSEEDTETN